MSTSQPATAFPAESSAPGNSRRQQMLHDIQQRAAHPVEHYPISTSLVVFGAGLGLGLMLGSMLAEASASRHRMSYAEQLGHSLMESLSSVMPDALTRRLHS